MAEGFVVVFLKEVRRMEGEKKSIGLRANVLSKYLMNKY